VKGLLTALDSADGSTRWEQHHDLLDRNVELVPSPDGAQLGFVSRYSVHLHDARTGQERELRVLPENGGRLQGFSFVDQGKALIAADFAGGVFRVDLGDGEVTELRAPAEGVFSRHSTLSPDQRWLFQTRDNTLGAVSLTSSSRGAA
jgi:hypothetical protein